MPKKSHENAQYVGGFDALRQGVPQFEGWSDEKMTYALKNTFPQLKDWSDDKVRFAADRAFGVEIETPNYTVFDAAWQNAKIAINHAYKNLPAGTLRGIPRMGANLVAGIAAAGESGGGPYIWASPQWQANFEKNLRAIDKTKWYSSLKEHFDEAARAIEKSPDLFDAEKIMEAIPYEYQLPAEKLHHYLTDPRRLIGIGTAALMQIGGQYAIAKATNPAVAMAVMAIQEGGEVMAAMDHYEQTTGKEIDPAYAIAVPVALMGVNMMLEKTGLDEIMKAGGYGLRGIVNKAIIGAITEGATEGLQEVSHVLAESGYEGKQKTMDTLHRIVQSVVGGLVGGGVAAGGKGIHTNVKAAGYKTQIKAKLVERGVPVDEAEAQAEKLVKTSFEEDPDAPLHQIAVKTKEYFDTLKESAPAQDEEVPETTVEGKRKEDMTLADLKEADLRSMHRHIVSDPKTPDDHWTKQLTEDEFIEHIKKIQEAKFAEDEVDADDPDAEVKEGLPKTTDEYSQDKFLQQAYDVTAALKHQEEIKAAAEKIKGLDMNLTSALESMYDSEQASQQARENMNILYTATKELQAMDDTALEATYNMARNNEKVSTHHWVKNVTFDEFKALIRSAPQDSPLTPEITEAPTKDEGVDSVPMSRNVDNTVVEDNKVMDEKGDTQAEDAMSEGSVAPSKHRVKVRNTNVAILGDDIRGFFKKDIPRLMRQMKGSRLIGASSGVDAEGEPARFYTFQTKAGDLIRVEISKNPYWEKKMRKDMGWGGKDVVLAKAPGFHGQRQGGSYIWLKDTRATLSDFHEFFHFAQDNFFTHGQMTSLTRELNKVDDKGLRRYIEWLHGIDEGKLGSKEFQAEVFGIYGTIREAEIVDKIKDLDSTRLFKMEETQDNAELLMMEIPELRAVYNEHYNQAVSIGDNKTEARAMANAYVVMIAKVGKLLWGGEGYARTALSEAGHETLDTIYQGDYATRAPEEISILSQIGEKLGLKFHSWTDKYYLKKGFTLTPQNPVEAGAEARLNTWSDTIKKGGVIFFEHADTAEQTGSELVQIDFAKYSDAFSTLASLRAGLLGKNLSKADRQNAVNAMEEKITELLKEDLNAFLEKNGIDKKGRPASETKPPTIDFREGTHGPLRSGYFVKWVEGGAKVKVFDSDKGKFVTKIVPDGMLRYKRGDPNAPSEVDNFEATMDINKEIDIGAVNELIPSVQNSRTPNKVFDGVKKWFGRLHDYLFTFGEAKRLSRDLYNVLMRSWHGLSTAVDRGINYYNRWSKFNLSKEEAAIAAMVAEEGFDEGDEIELTSFDEYKEGEKVLVKVTKRMKKAGEAHAEYLQKIGEQEKDEGILSELWPQSLINAHMDTIARIQDKRVITKKDRQKVEELQNEIEKLEGLRYVSHSKVAKAAIEAKLKRIGLEDRAVFLKKLYDFSFRHKQRRGVLTLREYIRTGLLQTADVDVRRYGMEATIDYFQKSAVKTIFDYARESGLVKFAPKYKRETVKKSEALNAQGQLRPGYEIKNGQYIKIMQTTAKEKAKWRRANVPAGWTVMGPNTTGLIAKEYSDAYIHPMLAHAYKEFRMMREYHPSKLRVLFNTIKIAQFIKPQIIWVHDFRQHFFGGAANLPHHEYQDFMEAFKIVGSKSAVYDELQRGGVYQRAQLLSRTATDKAVDIALRMNDPAKVERMKAKIEKLTGAPIGKAMFKKNIMMLYHALANATWYGDEVLRTWTYLSFKRMGMPHEVAMDEAGRVHGAYATISHKYKKDVGWLAFVQTFRIMMPVETARIYLQEPVRAISNAIKGKEVPDYRVKQIAKAYAYLFTTMVFMPMWLAARGWKPDKWLWKWRKKVATESGDKEIVIASNDFMLQLPKYAIRLSTYSPIENKPRWVQGLKYWQQYEIHPFWRSLQDIVENRRFLKGGKVYDPNADGFTRTRQQLTYIFSQWFRVFEGLESDIDRSEASKKELHDAIDNSMSHIEQWIFAKNLVDPLEAAKQGRFPSAGTGMFGYTYLRGSREDWIRNLYNSLELARRERIGEIRAAFRRGTLNRKQEDRLIENLEKWTDRALKWIRRQEELRK